MRLRRPAKPHLPNSAEAEVVECDCIPGYLSSRTQHHNLERPANGGGSANSGEARPPNDDLSMWREPVKRLHVPRSHNGLHLKLHKTGMKSHTHLASPVTYICICQAKIPSARPVLLLSSVKDARNDSAASCRSRPLKESCRPVAVGRYATPLRAAGCNGKTHAVPRPWEESRLSHAAVPCCSQMALHTIAMQRKYLCVVLSYRKTASNVPTTASKTFFCRHVVENSRR